MKYPVVKIESFILSPSFADASATRSILASIRRKCAMLTACYQVFLADEGPRGQQEGGGVSPLFPFGNPEGAT